MACVALRRCDSCVASLCVAFWPNLLPLRRYFCVACVALCRFPASLRVAKGTASLRYIFASLEPPPCVAGNRVADSLRRLRRWEAELSRRYRHKFASLKFASLVSVASLSELRRVAQILPFPKVPLPASFQPPRAAAGL